MATLEAGTTQRKPLSRCLENGGTREQGDLEPPDPNETPSTQPCRNKAITAKKKNKLTAHTWPSNNHLTLQVQNAEGRNKTQRCKNNEAGQVTSQPRPVLSKPAQELRRVSQYACYRAKGWKTAL